jgi:predicted dehydrogenase
MKTKAKGAGTGISRRAFLATSATAVAAPMILPQGVLAMNGRPGANDRIVTGHIGVGGMGSGHLNAWKAHTACVADVDMERQTRAKGIVGRDIDTYSDWRHVLDRKDIDAVIIAAPDHWHAYMTVAACQAGFDVYCEKPACKSREESKAMVNAARRYGKVVQIGSQGRSAENAFYSCQYLWNKQIGDVDHVYIWHVNNYTTEETGGFGDPPDTLDWDMWLGPSPWRPYNPNYMHFNFRWMLDWGEGFIRDRGAHVLSLMHWFLEIDGKYPKRVSSTGVPQKTGIWDCPLSMETTWEYEDPKLTVHWVQPGEGATPHDFGAVYHGSQGKLVVEGGDGWTGAEQIAKDYVPGPGGRVPYKSPGHMEEFFKCIKTRERTNMDVELGCNIVDICNMAMISYKVGRPLEWDAANDRFVNDAEADRWLSLPGRGQWTL